MRKIKLPTSNTVVLHVDLTKLESGAISIPYVGEGIPVGEVGQKEFKDLEIARHNGSTIIWATVCLEKKIERLIVDYFMGPFKGPCSRRHLLEIEVLQSSSFQFNFKKNLVQKISEEFSALKGKDNSKLQGYLRKIMLWRNAFAHGELKCDSKKGVVLYFYSGSQQEQRLDVSFWADVEQTFEKCGNLLNKLEFATAGIDEPGQHL
jgi:hypothetical protein